MKLNASYGLTDLVLKAISEIISCLRHQCMKLVEQYVKMPFSLRELRQNFIENSS